jgi:hypothetical protein
MPLGDFGLVEIPAMGALRSHHTECDQIRTGHAVSLAIGLAFEARLQLGQMSLSMVNTGGVREVGAQVQSSRAGWL